MTTNRLRAHTRPTVLFLEINSFFRQLCISAKVVKNQFTPKKVGQLTPKYSLADCQWFNPDISVQHVVAFGLKFQAAGRVGDAFAPVVPPVDT